METFISADLVQHVTFVIVATLGIMETIKVSISIPKKVKPVMTAILSTGLAFISLLVGFEWVKLAILSWSLTQLAYDLILKTVINVLDKIDGQRDVEKPKSKKS
jgi:hypothetical protein